MISNKSSTKDEVKVRQDCKATKRKETNKSGIEVNVHKKTQESRYNQE
jgi:hypothetical protein